MSVSPDQTEDCSISIRAVINAHHALSFWLPTAMLGNDKKHQGEQQVFKAKAYLN
jgi:hypothetical protein